MCGIEFVASLGMEWKSVREKQAQKEEDDEERGERALVTDA
jgi:hypothetical protein